MAVRGRRGVSGILAALLLVMVSLSSLAAVLTLTGRSLEYSREALESSAERARDTAAPPALSLEAAGGSLVATVVSQNPAEVKWFVVERADGSVEVKPGGRVHGATRFTLSTGYDCQPVRVYMILSSGAAVAYDPRNDPLVARMPEGWDGWWRCGIAEGTGGGGGVYDPRVWLKTTGLGGGGNDTTTIPVNWQGGRSAQVLVGASISPHRYTWGECGILVGWDYEYDYQTDSWKHIPVLAPEIVIGGFTVQGSRVDVVLGCARGWPIALYLALRGPDDMVFSGRVDFSYRVTYRTESRPRDSSFNPSPDPSLEGPLPVGYTPIGHSSYTARRSWWNPGGVAECTYEGSATINYRMSTVMVLLVWAYLRPFYWQYNPDNPYVSIDVSVGIRVANVTRVSPNPVSLDLGVVDAVRVKLYKYNLTSFPIITSTSDQEPLLVREQVMSCSSAYGIPGQFCRSFERVYVLFTRVSMPEPFSYAVYKVYQSLLPGAPRVQVVASVNGVEFRRLAEPGKATEVAFPGARFRVEVTPYVHPPLFNDITTSYRDVNDRVREYSGRTHPAPSMSPWRGPALMEIETPKSRFLTALSWPGVLAVTQLDTTYRGYAQLVAGHPYTVTPDEMVRVARAWVDSGSLVVAVEQTVFANPPPGRPPDLRGYAGSHIVITVATRNHYATESIIAWVG